jgi:hypothetical protein
VAPIVVWFVQQRKNEKLQRENEKLQLKLKEEEIQLAKEKHQVEMHERLSKLLDEQRHLYADCVALIHQGHIVGESFELQQKIQPMEEKEQEIENIKQIISRLTGKEIGFIKGGIPPLPPSGLRVTPQ